MSLKNFIEEIPFSTGCGVIKFDDSGLIAISKKAGRASHPNPNGRDGKPPMVRAAYNFDGEYYAWQTPGGEKQKLYLVNRLDSPTSGVILAAAKVGGIYANDTYPADFIMKNLQIECNVIVFDHKNKTVKISQRAPVIIDEVSQQALKSK